MKEKQQKNPVLDKFIAHEDFCPPEVIFRLMDLPQAKTRKTGGFPRD